MGLQELIAALNVDAAPSEVEIDKAADCIMDRRHKGISLQKMDLGQLRGSIKSKGVHHDRTQKVLDGLVDRLGKAGIKFVYISDKPRRSVHEDFEPGYLTIEI